MRYGAPAIDKEKTKMEEKISTVEERLRAIEGLNLYGSIDVSSLWLVPNAIVPQKFKVMEFEKYNRTLDPRIHLATYIAKMSAFIDNDKLLIHFFHEELTSPRPYAGMSN